MDNCSTNDNYTHAVIPGKAITGTLYAVSIIVPNFIIIGVICRTSWVLRQNSIPRILMAGLCVTDLGFGVMNCIPQVVNYWAGYCAAGGTATCLYLGYMQTFFLKSSQGIVALMSLERAIAIVSPFRYPQIWTSKSAVGSITMVFFYANIVAVLPFAGINKYGYRSFCWFTWDDSSPLGRAYVYYFVAEGFILTSVMVICNVAVIRELLRMHRSGERTVGSSTVKPEFIALMISVSVLFVICTTPLLIRMLSVQMGVGLSAESDFLAMRLFITNSAINSHVYWVLRVVVGKKLLTRAVVALASLLRRGSATVTPIVESEVGVEKSEPMGT